MNSTIKVLLVVLAGVVALNVIKTLQDRMIFDNNRIEVNQELLKARLKEKIVYKPIVLKYPEPVKIAAKEIPEDTEKTSHSLESFKHKVKKVLVNHIGLTDQKEISFYVKLLTFTAIIESKLYKYKEQLSGGPALGAFQIEPNTHIDLLSHYISFNSNREKTLQGLYNVNQSLNENLRDNLQYQIAVCYYNYDRRDSTSNHQEDLYTVSSTWKRYHNTFQGAGSISQGINDYNSFINNI